MLKHTSLLLALGATLTFTACKKTDAAYEPSAAPQAEATTTATAWKAAGEWKTSQQEQFKIQYAILEDKAITADVAAKGLVLVYAKDASGVQSLPYQSSQSDVFWYYQVAEGSVLVSCDVYGSAKASAPEFTYFIFSEEKIADLEKSGKSKGDLMNLSFGQAAALAN